MKKYLKTKEQRFQFTAAVYASKLARPKMQSDENENPYLIDLVRNMGAQIKNGKASSLGLKQPERFFEKR